MTKEYWELWRFHSYFLNEQKLPDRNHLGGGPVVRTWDQEVCFLCGFRFKPCGCSYDGYWRLTWSLTSGPVGLVEVRASWPGHPRWTKKKNFQIDWCQNFNIRLRWTMVQWVLLISFFHKLKLQREDFSDGLICHFGHWSGII